MGQAPSRYAYTAAAVALAVLTAFAGPATAHHPSGWHWARASNPFRLRLVDSVTSAWQGPVEAAAAEWSERSEVVRIRLDRGSTKRRVRRKCPAPDRGVRICNFDYGNKPWSAITRLVVNGNHIVRGRIKLNDRGAIAFRALSCHEIGHALGLAHRHQDETSSCLTPIVAASQIHPDTHDIRQLARIYAHGDGSASAADVYGAQDVHHVHDGDVRVTKRGPLTIIDIRTPRTPPSRFTR